MPKKFYDPQVGALFAALQQFQEKPETTYEDLQKVLSLVEEIVPLNEPERKVLAETKKRPFGTRPSARRRR
jgi:hypothetical protein